MHNENTLKQNKKNRSRLFADFRFRAYGILGLLIAGGALLFLLVNIFSTGYSAFQQTVVTLEFNLDAETLGVTSTSIPE